MLAVYQGENEGLHKELGKCREPEIYADVLQSSFANFLCTSNLTARPGKLVTLIGSPVLVRKNEEKNMTAAKATESRNVNSRNFSDDPQRNPDRTQNDYPGHEENFINDPDHPIKKRNRQIKEIQEELQGNIQRGNPIK